MTIEEKARAYDEALNRCKEWASGTWGHSVDDSPKDIAEFIFPQLAESEDERTRKALINYFKAHSSLVGENWNGIECDDVVAYLEKQKDASKAIEAVERIDKYIDQHLANAHDMKDSNPDKKYYRGWDDALGKMAGILQDVYSGEKQKESLRDFIDDFPYSCEQEKPENISASTMIPSFHEELTEFELVLFNAVLDNNFVGAKGSENALAMTKKVAPELLAIAKNEMKPDEWDKREKLFTKALQTANAQIGQLFEENKKLKEQQPTEIDEYKIIKKHITEDSLSSEVNKRLKECGWYVTDTESSEWSEDDEKDIAHIIRVLDDCYAYGKHDLSKTDHENLVNTLKSIHPQLKSEWSEEDEGELQNAIDALEFLGKKGVYKSESGYDAALQAASWLKNLSLDLKKRNEDVTKLCSNEWSEEDEEIFNNIIEKAKGGHWIEVNEITWLIAWFKSLRLQPKQE